MKETVKKMTTSAPGKLLLFGDHAVVYGYPCIVTAIDQRVFVTVELRNDDLFTVNTPDLKTVAYQKKLGQVGQGELPQAAGFLEAVLGEFLLIYPQKIGINISTKSDFSAQYGFGSSSAVSVAFAQALQEIYDVKLSKQQLFALVYRAVRHVQGVGSGFDIAAAIWGGTIYYLTPAKVVEVISSTEIPLVVGYTGIKVSTAQVIREVAEAKKRDAVRVDRLFQRSTEIVEQAKLALAKRDWSLVGHLMNQNQTVLAELGVSSPELYHLIDAAKKAGAFGAKLSGAGKGDCMVAVADADHFLSVEAAINQVGGQAISLKTNAEGVRVEEVR